MLGVINFAHGALRSDGWRGPGGRGNGAPGPAAALQPPPFLPVDPHVWLHPRHQRSREVRLGPGLSGNADAGVAGGHGGSGGQHHSRLPAVCHRFRPAGLGGALLRA
ncbi:hypothetical protein G6F65_022611 [Rhizopus arrhizus]|nr:hypothetical protein G6F65_022611 [Rhizopus arrhizus]